MFERLNLDQIGLWGFRYDEGLELFCRIERISRSEIRSRSIAAASRINPLAMGLRRLHGGKQDE